MLEYHATATLICYSCISAVQSGVPHTDLTRKRPRQLPGIDDLQRVLECQHFTSAGRRQRTCNYLQCRLII